MDFMARRSSQRSSWRNQVTDLPTPRIAVAGPPAPPPLLPRVIARAEALLSVAHVERARSIAQQQMPMGLIQDEQLLDEALAFGALTCTEASLGRNQRIKSVFERCLCLELGQALLVTGQYAVAYETFQQVADGFADPAGRCDTAVRALQPLPSSSGLFLREVYTNWGRAAERQHAGASSVAAARAVYELAAARKIWADPLQRPQERYLRALTARPFWEASSLPVARALEAAASEIIAEYRALMPTHFSSIKDRGPDHGGADDRLVTTGKWTDFQLYAGCRKDHTNCMLCPRTSTLIASLPDLNTVIYGTHWISRLAPGTHLSAHCGPSNFKLRCHLSLQTSPGARMRVGHEEREWRQGECLVFDESYEHEVWHEGTEDRVVLICDMWHPELDVASDILPHCSLEQRQALEAARADEHLPRRKP